MQDRHRYIPLIVEEGGRMGEHARALLWELARRRPSRSLDQRLPFAARARMLVDRWMQLISHTIHSHMATLLRNGLRSIGRLNPPR